MEFLLLHIGQQSTQLLQERIIQPVLQREHTQKVAAIAVVHQEVLIKTIQ